MSIAILPAKADDRVEILSILRRAGNFTPSEIDVALELVDAWLTRGEASDYYVHVLREDEAVRGYVCFGPTPLTQGTYDLYWIAVDAESQGMGFGQTLLRFVEEQVRQRRGRLLLIETSSQESYGGTQRFYERAGYTVMARVSDFYKLGDDKVIFGKTVVRAD